MIVHTIPIEVEAKLSECYERGQDILKNAPKFIEEKTGIKPTGVARDGCLTFICCNIGFTIPKFLKGSPSLGLSPKNSTLKGKALQKEWAERFPSPGSPVFCFRHFNAGKLSVRTDKIKGVRYIISSQGIDLEKEGCKPVNVEDLAGPE